MRPGPWRVLLARRLEERGWRGQRDSGPTVEGRFCRRGWTRRWRLFGQCRLVHEQGSAFRCDLHQCLPGEATGPNVTVFPAAHGGERHPECLREVFLREPGTLTPGANHAGGIGRRHGLLGCGVRVVSPAHKDAGFVLTYGFLPDAARQRGRASECHSVIALMSTASVSVPSPRVWKKSAATRNDPKRGARLQGAAHASTNRGATRSDPAESRQAPIANRERRPLQTPALRTPTRSGTSCILLPSSP